MYRHNKIHLILCRTAVLAWALLHSPAGFTDSSNIEADIRVEADYMKFDMETGSSVYKGNVKVSQNGIVLSGETVTIQHQKNKIQTINVSGQPARYIQDNNGENKIHATSQHMQYFTDEHRLIMTVNARLQQPNHTIESQHIAYDTKSKTVIAGSSNGQNIPAGRVNITLTPKKDDSMTPANTEKP